MAQNKYAMITLEYPPDTGGVARMYGQIAKLMGDKLEVFVDRPNHANRNDTVTYVELINKHLKWKWYPSVKFLIQLARQKEYKKIIIGHVLPLGTAGYIASLFFGMSYDVILHGMDMSIPMKSFRKRWMIKKVLKRANRIICANKYVSKYVAELGISADKVSVIYPIPGIADETNNQLVRHLTEAYNLVDKPIILSVGRLVERKGFQYVIQSMEEVWKFHSDANLIIIGDGDYKEALEKLIATSSRSKNIHLLTKQTDNELAAWYRNALIFVFTPVTLTNGDHEGFGIVNLEAQVYGKPVVASRSGGVPEAVIENKTGILVQEKNVVEISAAILKLIDNPDYAKKLGENGKLRVEQEFNLDQMEKKLASLYAD